MRLVSIPSDFWQRECILFRSSNLFSLCFIRDEIQSRLFFSYCLLLVQASPVDQQKKNIFFNLIFYVSNIFIFELKFCWPHFHLSWIYLMMAKVLQKLCNVFYAYSPFFSLSHSLSSPDISITSVAFFLGRSRWTAALSSSIKFSSPHCPTSKEKEVCASLLFLCHPSLLILHSH